MRPIPRPDSLAAHVRWALFLAMGLAWAPQAARAQFFDYGFGDLGATVGPEIYGNPPGYDYVTPDAVYGFGGIDFGYGPTTPGYGNGYSNFGDVPSYGYAYGGQPLGVGGPGFGGAVVGNPVIDAGQDAPAAQGRATDRKATKKAAAKPAKRPAGAPAAERKDR